MTTSVFDITEQDEQTDFELCPTGGGKHYRVKAHVCPICRVDYVENGAPGYTSKGAKLLRWVTFVNTVDTEAETPENDCGG